VKSRHKFLNNGPERKSALIRRCVCSVQGFSQQPPTPGTPPPPEGGGESRPPRNGAAPCVPAVPSLVHAKSTSEVLMPAQDPAGDNPRQSVNPGGRLAAPETRTAGIPPPTCREDRRPVGFFRNKCVTHNEFRVFFEKGKYKKGEGEGWRAGKGFILAGGGSINVIWGGRTSCIFFGGPQVGVELIGW